MKLHDLSRHRRALRVLQLALGCIALCTTVAAQAAEERPPEDDWFTLNLVEGVGRGTGIVDFSGTATNWR